MPYSCQRRSTSCLISALISISCATRALFLGALSSRHADLAAEALARGGVIELVERPLADPDVALRSTLAQRWKKTSS